MSRSILGVFVFVFAFGVFFNFGHIETAGGNTITKFFSLSSLAEDDYCCDDDSGDDYYGDDYVEDTQDDYCCDDDTSVDDSEDDYCCDDDDSPPEEDPIEEPDEDPIPPLLPFCTLTATPGEIGEYEWATLKWTSQYANTGSIDKGVGSLFIVTSPNASGSKTVHPTVTTTYTATFVGEDGTVTCKTTVVVKIPPPETPVCTLTPESQYIHKGDSAKLTWTSEYAVTGIMDESVGTLSPVEGGFVNVSPTETTSYKATFTGPGGTVDCHATVKVKTPPPSGMCEMEIKKSVEKTSFVAGEIVEYTIEFKNIGTKNCTGGGVKVVDVIDPRLSYLSETHSSDVDGGYGSDPVYKISDKTLRWNANTLTPGESGWVKWKATVATPTSCSEVVPNTAKITSFEYSNFSEWVYSNTVNITLTKSCYQPKTPVCTLEAEKNVIKKGESSTLFWTSANVTSGILDEGIGAISPVSNGTVVVYPTETTSYKATFTGPHGTVDCHATVTVTTSTNSYVPACTMTINPGQISRGANATLSWTGTNVTSLTIDKGIGATSTVNSSLVVAPEDNTTYTGVFSGPHGTITCQASITVTTGGGGCSGHCGRGQQPPKVVLYQKPVNQPLAAVYLSQIPYTGFDAGPITTAIYWTLLVIWSALVAYFLVYRGYWSKVLPATGAPTKTKRRPMQTIEEELDADEAEESVVLASTMALPTYANLPFNLPVSANIEPIIETEGVLQPVTTLERAVEKRLGEDKILISKYGMERLASVVSDETSLMAMLEKVAYAARRNYAREDGWIALSDTRVEETLTNVLPGIKVASAAAPVAATSSVSVAPVSTARTSVSETPVEFVSAIIVGEKDKVFATLRGAAQSGKGVDALMMEAVLLLDRVYRARVENANGADETLKSMTSNLGTKELEELVRILSAAIDETYSSSLTSAKIALANALSFTAKFKK